jgi:hypothetical protein
MIIVLSRTIKILAADIHAVIYFLIVTFYAIM